MPPAPALKKSPQPAAPRGDTPSDEALSSAPSPHNPLPAAPPSSSASAASPPRCPPPPRRTQPHAQLRFGPPSHHAHLPRSAHPRAPPQPRAAEVPPAFPPTPPATAHRAGAPPHPAHSTPQSAPARPIPYGSAPARAAPNRPRWQTVPRRAPQSAPPPSSAAIPSHNSFPAAAKATHPFPSPQRNPSRCPQTRTSQVAFSSRKSHLARTQNRHCCSDSAPACTATPTAERRWAARAARAAAHPSPAPPANRTPSAGCSAIRT